MSKCFKVMASFILVLLLTAQATQVYAYTYNKRPTQSLVNKNETVEFELPNIFDENMKRENIQSLAVPIVGENGFESGSGTENDPYIIKTDSQLKYFEESVNDDKISYDGKFIKLDADIKVTDIANYEKWDTEAPEYSWTPIGKNMGTQFMGTFDGADHTISGIYIKNTSTGYYLGLFGVTKNAVIKNLRLDELYINGNAAIGGFVGYYGADENVSIENCILYDNCKITGENNTSNKSSYIGGIAGYVTATGNSTVKIKNCANISAKGIIGEIMTGAIVGYADNKAITEGNNNGTHILISDCYNKSSVTGIQYTGGIIGCSTASVTNCFNVGDVNKDNTLNIIQSGAIIGSGLQSVNSYYLKDCGAAGSGTALTAEQIKSPKISYLLNTNGVDTTKTDRELWAFESSENILCLIYNNVANTTNSGTYPYTLPDQTWYSDSAKVNGAYVLDSYSDLLAFSRIVYNNIDSFSGDTVKLSKNITLSTNDYYFEPIGTPENAFKGTFDGSIYTVSGLKIDTNADCQGFFGSNAGIVKNLNLTNVNFKQPGCTYENDSVIYDGLAMQMGGIAGDNSGTISKCNVAGSISGLIYIGGIVGDNSGVITDCLNTATVTADENYAGGIAGSSNTSYSLSVEVCLIKNCVNIGTVSRGGIPDSDNGELLKYGGIDGNNIINYNCYYKVGCGLSDVENKYIEEGSGNALDANSLKSATAAFLLNTNGGVTENSGIWTTGTTNPVFVSGTAVATTAPGGSYGGVIPDIAWHGNGDTLTVTTFAQLLAFTRLVNNGVDDFAGKTVELGGDIEMNFTCLDTWEAIGTYAHPFKGIFNGKGHTVSNICIDANVDYQGFFGYIDGDGASVKNLNVKIDHIYIYAPSSDIDYKIGGIVGKMTGTDASITDCNVLNHSDTAYINAEMNKNFVGGVVGEFSGANITDCYNEMNITGQTIGGIVGLCKGNIINCKNAGNINYSVNSKFVSATYAGGIIGKNTKPETVIYTIDNCINNGNVNADYSGGIAGNNFFEITDCFNNGEISSGKNNTAYTGGITGVNQYIISNCLNAGDIDNKTTEASMAGGITGNNIISNSSVSECMNYGTVTGYCYGGGIAGNNSGSITKCSNGGNINTQPGLISSNGSNLGGISGCCNYKIENCYNIGNVEGYSYIGGICGNQKGGTIDKCYSVGRITSEISKKFANMIIGNYTTSGTVTDCYYLDENKPDTDEPFGTAITESNMQNSANFINFNFNDIWTMSGYSTYKYPELKALDHSIYSYREYDVNNDGYKDINDVKYLQKFINSGGYEINYEFFEILNNQNPSATHGINDVTALIKLILMMDQPSE